jgi:excinuclease ABC subunit A
VKFHGHSIADILELTIEDALTVLKDVPQVNQKLQTLVDVGLGYVHLGQSATTLSGGEAQRMKLARELSKRQTGRTMYVLDEPTTGLHFDDVRKLLEVLHRLADLGNSVIIIEHNLDVIHNADWIIDLGPEGGENGGRLVAQGRPAKVAATAESYTGQFLRRYYTAADGQLKELEEEAAALLFDDLPLENDEQAVVTNSTGNGKGRTKRASFKDTKTNSVKVKSSSATEKTSAASTNTGGKRVKKTGKA